jgi:hypothetical protein
MPPAAMTLMYAEAKGISLSRLDALSPALDIGTRINPITTKSGIGIINSNGRKPVKRTITRPATETGIVKVAIKSISDT